MFINEKIFSIFIIENIYYRSYCRISENEAGLFEALYIESSIYHPSRVFRFPHFIREVGFGQMNRHDDVIDSVIFICESQNADDL